MKMWFRMLVLALAGAGVWGYSPRAFAATEIMSSATMPKENVVRVEVTAGADGKPSTVRVDGKEAAPANLVVILRKAQRPTVCEIRVPAGAEYERLSEVLIAAAQADIKKLRLGADGGKLMDYRMPALDVAGDSKATPLKPITLTHRKGATWAAIGDASPIRISAAGDADRPGDAEFQALLSRKAENPRGNLQVIITPRAGVSCGDVLAVYGDCLGAKITQVGFSPAEGSGPTNQAEGPANKRGHRIVFIIDHSTSVRKSFDAIRAEVIRSVNNMIPIQRFDAVMVSESSDVVLPGMQAPTAEVKKDFAERMSKFTVAGEIAGKLAPFQEAFEKAFSLKPDSIYFLNASAFDPKLAAVVEGLNKDKKVHVYAIVFEPADEKFEKQMQELAGNNGGVYKVVTQADVAHDAPQGTK